MAETSLSPNRISDGISRSTFPQTWSPSGAAALDTSTLPLPRAHRAWERKPQPPHEKDARYRKVWKRYGLRSEQDDKASSAQSSGTADVNGTDARERAVKRMCINEGPVPKSIVAEEETRTKYAGTKYDRRKSGFIRKTRPLRDVTNAPLDHPAEESASKNHKTEGNCEDVPSAARPTEMTESNDDSSSRRAVAPVRKRRSLGRHSLGAQRAGRQSLGGFSFERIVEEPAKEVEALCLSPRKTLPTWKTTAISEESETPATALADTSGASIDVVESNNAEHVEETTQEGDDEDSIASNPLLTPQTPTRAAPSPQNTGEAEAMSPQRTTPDAQEDITSQRDEDEAAEEDGAPANTAHEEENDDVFDEEQDKADSPTTSQTDEPASTWADETTTHLELDTALLKDFLSRTAAAKASKLGSGSPRLSLARRSSLLNRHDSDAIRSALASPRKPLDDKDTNSPAPTSSTRILDLPGVKNLASQLDAITGGPLDGKDTEGNSTDVDESGILGSRRSARTRTRLPALSAVEKTPNKISVKRTDGSEPVIVKKTEAQELSILTRANTRRNKGTSVARHARLKKLRDDGMAENWVEGQVKEMAAINVRESAVDGVEAQAVAPANNDQEGPWKVPADGEKGVRWRSETDLLTYFGGAAGPEASSSEEPAPGTGAPSKIPPPSTLTALSVSVLQAQSDIDSPRKKSKSAQPQAPRLRRLRGLGAANGTPAKGLLSSASLLPDDVAEEATTEKEKEKEKSKLPTAKERKSRIATPRKLKLASSATSAELNAGAEAVIPKSLGGPGAVGPALAEAKEVKDARERRLASPRKLPLAQFGGSASAAPPGGVRKRTRIG